MLKVEKLRRWIGGRYEVVISWKEEFFFLFDNREEVEKRLFFLEKNFFKKLEVARRYKEVMNVNVEKGYVRKLEINEVEDSSSWYFLYFLVIREDREIIKVRIVFDSVVRCKGVFLNDAMFIGFKF